MIGAEDATAGAGAVGGIDASVGNNDVGGIVGVDIRCCCTAVLHCSWSGKSIDRRFKGIGTTSSSSPSSSASDWCHRLGIFSLFLLKNVRCGKKNQCLFFLDASSSHSCSTTTPAPTTTAKPNDRRFRSFSFFFFFERFLGSPRQHGPRSRRLADGASISREWGIRIRVERAKKKTMQRQRRRAIRKRIGDVVATFFYLSLCSGLIQKMIFMKKIHLLGRRRHRGPAAPADDHRRSSRDPGRPCPRRRGPRAQAEEAAAAREGGSGGGERQRRREWFDDAGVVRGPVPSPVRVGALFLLRGGDPDEEVFDE